MKVIPYKFILICLILPFFVFSFQNCSDVQFNANIFDSVSYLSGGGNAGGYDGKLTRHYYRYIDGHRCNRREAPYAHLKMPHEEPPILITNKAKLCGDKKGEIIDIEDIRYSLTQKDLVSYREGLYLKKPLNTQPAFVKEYVEALCEWSEPKTGELLELTLKYNRNSKLAEAKYLYKYLEGKTLKQEMSAEFEVERSLLETKVSYKRPKFLLAIDFKTLIKSQKGVFEAQLLTHLKKLKFNKKLRCRMGGDLDIQAPQLKYLVNEYYPVNKPINPVTPNSLIPFTQFTIHPPLPLGIQLNTATGRLFGRPTVLSEKKVYEVTASNGSLENVTWIEFGVGLEFEVTSNSDSFDANPIDQICADSTGNCSFRAAIEEANQNKPFHSSIILPSGQYLITQGEMVIDSDLWLLGEDRATTIIDGGGSSRIFNVMKNRRVKIKKMTLTKGQAPLSESGGAILAEDGSGLELSEVIIEESQVGADIIQVGGQSSKKYRKGGGVYLGHNSMFKAVDSIVRNNQSYSDGGGIYSRGAVTLERVQISGNRAERIANGGGVYVNGELFIRNSWIHNNFTNFSGGGVFVRCHAPSLDIINTTFSRNRAGAVAGGIDIDFSCHRNVHLKNLLFFRNIGAFGGAFGYRPHSVYSKEFKRRAKNLTLIDNVADYGSSILLGGFEPLEIGNSVIVGSISQRKNCYIVENSELVSLGHNITSDESCQLGEQHREGDIQNAKEAFYDNSQLIPKSEFQSFINPLPNTKLLGGSGELSCPIYDLLGQRRKSPCDIGAIEY